MKKVSIREILTQYRIVVPEIQRDYVWGSHPEVLAQFIGDLDAKLGKGRGAAANIGFLYSYPSGDENYVIDGQQRLTTVILLLHYLAAKDPGLHEGFKKLILPDDTVPTFAYRVRPVSLSFMKILFRSAATDSDSVRNLKDYKRRYDDDMTAKSCLAALDWFSKNLSKYANLTYDAVPDNVEFWYFSVDQTSQGEELYITMNSRGERRTESEHIKPRLFNRLASASDRLKYGKEWDEWEEFFYRYRNGRDIRSVDTAMDNIIRIVAELNTENSIENISVYMSALSAILDMADMAAHEADSSFIRREISRLYGDDKGKPGFADGDFNILKSILTEYLRPVETTFHSIEQVYHLMRNLSVRGILKSSKDLLALLAEMKDSEKPFYDFMLEGYESGRWKSVIAGTQEPRKIRIFQCHGISAERLIWEAQETSLWKGDIKPLLDWATDDDGNFSVAEFDKMHRLLKDFFVEARNEGLVSDDTRRALLTFDMAAYPWWRYDSQACFGHTADEWRQIILMNPGEFRYFLNVYAESGLTAEDFCRRRIEECSAERDWSEFVKFDYLLKYLNTKHVSYTSGRGLFLEKNCYASQISVNDEHLFQILKENEQRMSKRNYWVGKEHTGNDNWVLVTDGIVRIGIWYEQSVEKIDDKKLPAEQCYVVRLQKNYCNTPEENKAALGLFAEDFEFLSDDDNLALRFEWNPEKDYYMLRVPFPSRNDFRGAALTIVKLLEQLMNSPASRNNWRYQDSPL